MTNVIVVGCEKCVCVLCCVIAVKRVVTSIRKKFKKAGNGWAGVRSNARRVSE